MKFWPCPTFQLPCLIGGLLSQTNVAGTFLPARAERASWKGSGEGGSVTFLKASSSPNGGDKGGKCSIFLNGLKLVQRDDGCQQITEAETIASTTIPAITTPKESFIIGLTLNNSWILFFSFCSFFASPPPELFSVIKTNYPSKHGIETPYALSLVVCRHQLDLPRAHHLLCLF